MLQSSYQSLTACVEDACAWLSGPREKNPERLVFRTELLEVWSEQTAGAVLLRTDGRRCLIVLFHRQRGRNGGDWDWFVPTDSHANGFPRIREALFKTERANLAHWQGK